MRLPAWLIALPLALGGICSLGMEQSARPAASARAVRVLFIGNSLTYVNDVPAIVAALAEAAGETPPVCRAVVGGGFSLEDHWNRGEAAKALEQEKWDFVVLQQGPSASPEGRALLLRCARRPPVGLPARLTLRSGAVVELSEHDARLLQEAAARANEEYGLAAR